MVVALQYDRNERVTKTDVDCNFFLSKLNVLKNNDVSFKLQHFRRAIINLKRLMQSENVAFNSYKTKSTPN